MLGDLQQLFIDAFDQNLEGLSPTGVWKHASPLSDLQRPFFGDLNQILENESLLGDLQQFFIDAVNQKLENVSLLGDMQQLLLGALYRGIEARELAQ